MTPADRSVVIFLIKALISNPELEITVCRSSGSVCTVKLALDTSKAIILSLLALLKAPSIKSS